MFKATLTALAVTTVICFCLFVCFFTNVQVHMGQQKHKYFYSNTGPLGAVYKWREKDPSARKILEGGLS